MNVQSVLDVAVLSDAGLVRGHNEDSTGADLGSGLLMVADGMGGYRAGEVASAIAVTATVRSYRSGLRGLIDLIEDDETSDQQVSAEGRVLRDAFRNANNLILDTADANPEYQGMGTTVVGLSFHDSQVSVGHVGDSRAYRYRGDELTQLTSDHTVRQELIDRGLYTREEADAAISRNLVTRALGIDKGVSIDVADHEFEPGDLYLLCSDGLNDMLEFEDIQKLVRQLSTDLDALAAALVRAANRAGGEDNISVLLARVKTANSSTSTGLTTGNGGSLIQKIFGWFRA